MMRSATSLRVRYAETDQMRMAYYGRFLDYFEVARTELLRSYGVSYRSFEEDGLFLPVLEAHVKYIQSARYDDELRIETSLDFNGGVALHIEYSVFCGENLLATGYTKHAFVRADTGKPCRPPKRFLDAIRS